MGASPRRLLKQIAPGYSIMSWQRMDGTQPNHSARQIREQRVAEVSRLLRGNAGLNPEALIKRYKVKRLTALTYLREARALNADRRGGHGDDV